MLFVVGKGPHRGRPLSAEELRGVLPTTVGGQGAVRAPARALRHSFGTALAEADVDLAVLREMMGHDHIDSSAAYIHLASIHVRAQFDAARDRLRAGG